jgi:plasmid stabilization system protein ParE
MEPVRVEFHPQAVVEATAAREWYAEISDPLCVAFSDELERVISRIAASPERWRLHLHGTRAILLDRFPYLVVYRVRSGKVEIIAVQHTRRRPGYWLPRLDS